MVSPNGAIKDKRGLGKAMAKGGMLFKSKGPAQMQKQEDEVRQRMNSASEVFRKAVQSNQQAKQEYFSLHLPKILRVRDFSWESGTEFGLIHAFVISAVVEGVCR
jgi:hypothetical protein